MLAGGCDASMDDLSFAGFSKMRATSRLGISRPFDSKRDGFVMSEGAVVLVVRFHSLFMDHSLSAGEAVQRPAERSSRHYGGDMRIRSFWVYYHISEFVEACCLNVYVSVYM